MKAGVIPKGPRGSTHISQYSAIFVLDDPGVVIFAQINLVANDHQQAVIRSTFLETGDGELDKLLPVSLNHGTWPYLHGTYPVSEVFE